MAALFAILWDLSVFWHQSSVDILLCSLKLHNPTKVLPYRHVGIIRLHTKHKQIFPEVFATSDYYTYDLGTPIQGHFGMKENDFLIVLTVC